MIERTIATALAASLLAIAVTLGGCAGDDDAEPATVTVSTTESVAATPAPGPAPAPASSPKRDREITLDYPEDAYPVVWLRKGEEVAIRTEPGGGKLVERVDDRTEFQSPTTFGVIEQRGKWAGVTTPKLANNELGWIELDRRRLHAGWTPLSIVVDLSERRAELSDAGKTVRSFAVTVGAPESETPTGRFSVTDTFRGNLDEAAYGCCALALSANQPNLPSGWFGGSRIAIHGTAGALGVAGSSGCVRAADADVDKLVSRVPLGTPVFIRT